MSDGALLASGQHLQLGGNHVVALASCQGGVLTLFKTGSAYFSPDGMNLDGGGQTVCVHVGVEPDRKAIRTVPFTGGILTEFSSGYVYRSANVLSLASGEHAFEGGAVSSERVSAMIPFRQGVLTAFTGGGVYFSPDGLHLAGGGGTIRVFPD